MAGPKVLLIKSYGGLFLRLPALAGQIKLLRTASMFQKLKTFVDYEEIFVTLAWNLRLPLIADSCGWAQNSSNKALRWYFFKKQNLRLLPVWQFRVYKFS